MADVYRGRALVKGFAAGEVLISKEPISFFGDVDPDSGVIVKKGHELRGLSLSGKIFVFPYGIGSTVGSYIIYRLSKKGAAPSAIVNVQSEPIIVAGCVLAKIPLMDRLEVNPLEVLRSGYLVEVNCFKGELRVLSKKA
ncbi:MAG: hypothetical protein DRJ31_00085 [Candidatus Methanomethylicota archaeon]|uniref:Phosphomevalonate dehydratase small subunit n=1 Tax=Thermoproteota archaeon TaxID=2056631 RepID=A0A497EVP6_9CREN|nr:MAG: hypothetical protein DRJ31_00085 [Candidatus Verstraetearchaeota archaeon]